MYAAIDDPYCYTDSTVLKNIPRIQDQAALDEFETAIVAQRSDEPLPRGRFSQHHYCAVHRHLFQDVYHWAGRFRTVRISKGGSTFCYPENIPAQIRKLFQELRQPRALQGLTRSEFLRSAAHFLGELNAIHPFREGNGRSQLAFVALIAAEAGHPLDLEKLVPEPFLGAMVASFHGDEEPLVGQLRILTG